MGTAARMAMPTDGLLTVSQWLSPAFPVSAYAYSQGFENAVTTGAVADAADAAHWIETVLRAGAGRNDAILLCLAIGGAVPVPVLADTARALAGSAERWRETRDQGTAFSETVAEMGIEAPCAVAYPVAFGVAARHTGLAPDVVAQLFLQALVSNLVSAAVRLVPIGQVAGQKIIAGLSRAVAAVAAEAALRGLDDLGGAALGAELAGLAHETQEVRLFRS
ncbi:MAG: urease accessory UreF family protein [Pseudomonadota bacterium]